MQRIPALLKDEPAGLTKSQIEKSITGKAEFKRQALDALIDEGYVVVRDGPRGSRICSNLRLYEGE